MRCNTASWKPRTGRALQRLLAGTARHSATGLFIGATLLVFVQSYRRHLWFGSGGRDLGLFHQSVWLLSRLAAPRNTILGMSAFADHMELIDLVLAPSQWFWPDATALLFVQALAVASGAAAIADLATRKLASRSTGVALGLAYLFAIDMQHAVMFDWNPTTLAAGFLPWVGWSFALGRRRVFVLALLGVALCKENLVLHALGLCLALGLEARHRPSDTSSSPDALARSGVRSCAAPSLAAADAWIAAVALALVFVVEMAVVFPLVRAGGFRHWRYEELGATPGAMARAIVRTPGRALALLVTPSEKAAGILAPWLGTAFLPLLAPRYLLALAPGLLERFWSTHANRWWGYYYGAPTVALLALATIDVLGQLAACAATPPSSRPGGLSAASVRSRSFLPPRFRRGAVIVLALLVLVCTLAVSMTLRGGPAPLLAARYGHHASLSDRDDAVRALAVIPADATVAAQNHLIPHLSARREIRDLGRPIVADYVALHFGQGTWPFAPGYPQALARQLLASGYGVGACFGSAVVLQRGAPVRPCQALGL